MVNDVIHIDDLLLIVIYVHNTTCIVQIVAEGWNM
jgi:hypothetical protein